MAGPKRAALKLPPFSGNGALSSDATDRKTAHLFFFPAVLEAPRGQRPACSPKPCRAFYRSACCMVTAVLFFVLFWVCVLFFCKLDFNT